jgi:HK97 family phage major capsid protein
MSVLLNQVRNQVKAKLADRRSVQGERDVRQKQIDDLVAQVEAEKRDLDPNETSRFNEIRGEIGGIDDQLKTLDGELDELNQRAESLEDNEKAKAAAQQAAERWGANAEDPESVQSPARVKSEPRTYSRDAERRGCSFFKDIYAHRYYNDPDAGRRLERHMTEARIHEAAGYETRDVGTSAFAGLTVPQYLTDLVAPAARAMAPTVAICNRHPLPPDGMTVNISRITTGTGVAVQATENAAVQETDADDTLLTVNVRTYAGQQDISRQALERGTGIDEIISQDLARAYWTQLDAAILNADGTGGTHLGIRSTTSIVSVTYTDASPTGAEAYKTIPELVSGIQSGVFMGATHLIMHPRRWWWLTASISSSFPLLNSPGVSTVQAGNIGSTEYMANNRNILGLPVVVDGNMLTNLGAGTEDVIIGVTNDELHLWHDDGGPLFIRAEQTGAGNLSVKFVVYSYSAFTAGRYPGAHGTISGTGLIAPVFSTA